MSSSLKILSLQGDAALPYLSELAKLRIYIFRDFPYLYEGSLEYEEKYLYRYFNCKESVLIVVIDGEKVVGVSSAIPMRYEVDEFKQPFIKQGYDVNTIFYYGESVLLHDYRGRGIGKRFFEEREKVARLSEEYKIVTFCAVDRPLNHPSRPKHYRSLDAFWQSQGFKKHPELQTTFHWKEIGEETESSKTMIFWLKTL